MRERVLESTESIVFYVQPKGASMDDQPNRRNRSWSRDELILALSVYVNLKPVVPSPKRPEVQNLSALLRAMEHSASDRIADDFRTPASIVMKLMNFRSLDDDYQGKGLEAAGKEDRLVWNELSGQVPLLVALADAIRITHSGQVGTRDGYGDDLIHDTFEGALLMRSHLARERDPRLARSKKKMMLRKHGRLACEVCEFDFADFYGARGDGFIECHHIRPLHELHLSTITRHDDLALVCANCHRMIHASRPVSTIAQLKSELTRQ